MVFLSRHLRLSLIAVLCSIDTAVSFVGNRGGYASRAKLRSTQARRMISPRTEDRLVLTGDAASLGFFGLVQSIVDPFEPSLSVALGEDAVADYRLDLLADPLVASAVVVPCWLLAGIGSEAYTVGASLRTAEESLRNAVRTYALYLPCVAAVLFLASTLNGTTVAAPDFTFCAGAISVVGSWRFTLANTIGR
mmetsp:Transcript_20534/g.48336  ORF Transcript_20534/g.48336 Transcript_20534/m.48336 type:complete len:193 (+) Transcript_20534:224-802(+)